MGFFLEVTLGGLMAGVLYSLVALGFVLIFKASGVFNFAQGAMVLFAALSLARLSEIMPLWLAFIAACFIMVAVAWVIEPGIFSGRRINVEIETEGHWTRGMTVADWWGALERKPNALFIRDLNRDALFRLMTYRIGRLDKR